jgi:enamine deaminase RidA (YjgF/YER057c/UK114 family)
MSARPRGARAREVVLNPSSHNQAQSSVAPVRMVSGHPSPNSSAGEGISSIHLGSAVRVPLSLVPEGRGPLQDQVHEILSSQQRILKNQGLPMTVSSQTVFLREPADLKECERILSQYYGPKRPATNFVLQPPCCGAALALEAWAIGGHDVRVEYCGPHTVTVSYDGMRWIYCAGMRSSKANDGVYGQTTGVLEQMGTALARAGSGFEHVVRTWFYLGRITEEDRDIQRYKELNRARTDFYRGIEFHCSTLQPNIPQGLYPASTGIGMLGASLVGGCVALETRREDALLLPLENPQQTPAYAYPPHHSPQSPKFSRGVVLVLDNYLTTWVSGTASVVHSNSRHPGNIEKQTEQTIENIEKLISPENLSFHGIKHPGARLTDVAKYRVYLKRPEDFARCKAICETRFGSVPAIYAIADVCRPELLVEIEGVAFSKRNID